MRSLCFSSTQIDAQEKFRARQPSMQLRFRVIRREMRIEKTGKAKVENWELILQKNGISGEALCPRYGINTFALQDPIPSTIILSTIPSLSFKFCF